jgi:ParB-like chromosome segregation protein Spo0J
LTWETVLPGGTVSLDRIHFRAEAWPRRYLDSDRVREFAELYRVEGVTALPPLELVADGRGGFLIGDGVHRCEAAREVGLKDVPAVVLPATGIEPVRTAYMHALLRSAISAKPLTRHEKRQAIRRLLREQPQSSDREIGRLVGADHKTVGRLRKQLELPNLLGDGEAGERLRLPTPERLLEKLVKDITLVHAHRGLLDFMRGGDESMGKRLAEAFRSVHGDEGLSWAQRFETWSAVAAAELEEDE